jgi:glycosyltransferase involved in cell wall biosynthesis
LTAGRRLGVYLELPYRQDASGYSVDRAFMLFVLELRRHFDSLTLVGRVDPEPGRAAYAIPADVEVFALPHYASLRDLTGLAASLPATLRAIWRAAGEVDVIWALGPHPMSIPVAVAGRLRRRRVVLGVRQHFPDYVRHRLPDSRWRAAVPAAIALEGTFRLLARRRPVIAVGADLAGRYRAAGAEVFELGVTLVRDADLAASAHPAIAAAGPVELLSVGRLDPEKAPELLLDMLDLLRSGGGRDYRLTMVGTGPLEAGLRDRVARSGAPVRLLGYVPFGPELLDVYRRSDLFVHVARTEGLPQVLIEAQSQGLPIVATSVGGVASALGDGAQGVLVPPGDAGALARAVEGVIADPGGQERMARAGLELARTRTLEAAAAAVAQFLAGRRDTPARTR